MDDREILRRAIVDGECFGESFRVLVAEVNRLRAIRLNAFNACYDPYEGDVRIGLIKILGYAPGEDAEPGPGKWKLP